MTATRRMQGQPKPLVSICLLSVSSHGWANLLRSISCSHDEPNTLLASNNIARNPGSLDDLSLGTAAPSMSQLLQKEL